MTVGRAETAGGGQWRGTRNPFPSAAVARHSDLRPEVPTIKTAAVRKIDQRIDGYLRATETGRGSDRAGAAGPGGRLAGAGQVIVVEGDYGTGKTHLALEALDRIEQSRAPGYPDTRVIYHVAPGGTFLTLYTDLMSKAVTADEVLHLVLEFYADIVADSFRGRPFTQQLVGQLKRGDIDPQLVIDRYGLLEGTLQQELHQRLSSVTGDETFGKALMLLLQPDLRAATWRWFVGGTPDQVLVEQGIAKPIQTDGSALEALGVIALLYGRKNRRFVLVIDEMERLVLTWDRTPRASTQAFKKLLEVFHAAGALLVACGLPDIFKVLPKDPGRIDAIIRPSLLTHDDVRWYIEETNERVYGRRTAEPFDEESIRYLVYLTSGVAREVVRFCYSAYEYASATGQEVTPRLVMSVAHDLSPGGSAEMVRSEIARLLSDQRRKAERHWLPGGASDVTVDFWIPVGERGAGCAILISDSVLEEAHVWRVREQLEAIRSSGEGREVLLVVSGYLPGNLRQSLTEVLARDSLIVYNPRSFEEDFTLAVNAAVERIIPGTGAANIAASADSELGALRAETERIARQQASTLRLVQELTSRVLAVGIASDERLGGIERALQAVSGTSATATDADPDLPAELEEIFSAAHRSLAAYGDVRKVVNEAFEIAAAEPGARFLTYRLREPDAFNPVGVAAFLSDVLAGFRGGVRAWLASLGHGHGPGPSPVERERLRVICRTYDALYGVVPLFKLDPLPDLTSLSESEQEMFSRVGRAVRRQELRQAFDGLGDRVYQAAIEYAGGSGGSPHRVAT